MTTGELLRAAGCTMAQLRGAMQSHKITPPPKNGSGGFVWPEGSVNVVREALSRDLRRKPFPQEVSA